MKLRGWVDGVEVNFDLTPPNTWKAIVPRQLDGTYIIQLKAISDMGNELNWSKIFIKINFQSMTMKVLPFAYIYNQEDEDIREKQVNSNFLYDEVSSTYNSQQIESKYIYNIIPLEFSYKELR